MSDVVSSRGFLTVLRSEELPPDFVVPCYLKVQKQRISLARVDGRIYAFADLCTCGDIPCPLSGGLLIGTTIMCQCHGSHFDISNGAVIDGSAERPLAVYISREVD